MGLVSVDCDSCKGQGGTKDTMCIDCDGFGSFLAHTSMISVGQSYPLPTEMPFHKHDQLELFPDVPLGLLPAPRLDLG